MKRCNIRRCTELYCTTVQNMIYQARRGTAGDVVGNLGCLYREQNSMIFCGIEWETFVGTEPVLLR